VFSQENGWQTNLTDHKQYICIASYCNSLFIDQERSNVNINKFLFILLWEIFCKFVFFLEFLTNHEYRFLGGLSAKNIERSWISKSSWMKESLEHFSFVKVKMRHKRKWHEKRKMVASIFCPFFILILSGKHHIFHVCKTAKEML
jgi:hypothetical protein